MSELLLLPSAMHSRILVVTFEMEHVSMMS